MINYSWAIYFSKMSKHITKRYFHKVPTWLRFFFIWFLPSTLEPDSRLQAPVLYPRVMRCLHFPTHPRSAWNPPNSASPQTPAPARELIHDQEEGFADASFREKQFSIHTLKKKKKAIHFIWGIVTCYLQALSENPKLFIQQSFAEKSGGNGSWKKCVSWRLHVPLPSTPDSLGAAPRAPASGLPIGSPTNLGFCGTHTLTHPQVFDWFSYFGIYLFKCHDIQQKSMMSHRFSRRGQMYTWYWFVLIYSKNHHNIVIIF